MVNFIIPLAAPETCLDWKRTSELCAGTVYSITRSVSNNYRVFIVSNRLPNSLPVSDKILTIEDNFAIPQSAYEKRVDKYKKLLLGYLYARKYGPAYCMNVDADDRISNRLVSWILSQDLSPGFVVQLGYMLQLGSRVLYFRNNFHQLCGTSALLWFNESDYPTSALDERHFATTRGHHLLYERM